MYIVTANYRDRKSPTRWIMREESQDPATIEPAKALVATNVNFDFAKSGTHEARVGCITVATCEKAEVVDGEFDFAGQQDKLVPLTYGWGAFCDPQNKTVNSCEKLFLAADGKMLALNPSKQKIKRTTQKRAAVDA